MMDGSSSHHGLVVYDSRPHSHEVMPGQLMAPLMVSPQYSPNAGPGIPFMAPPHYQSSVPYGPYNAPASLVDSPLPLKQEYPSQSDIRPMESLDSVAFSAARSDNRPYTNHGQISPVPSRRSSAASTETDQDAPTLNSKTITLNETLNPKDQIEFETDVDQLMKAIQFDDAPTKVEPNTPEWTPLSPSQTEVSSARSSPVQSVNPLRLQASPKIKKHVCDGPRCGKTFAQKTHLDIHKRTHTGARPYTCKFKDCNLTFSQMGNLRTHERRHTGERPYKCSKCDKTFAQKGNVRSHEQTHEGQKPFRCHLDNCDKVFSQLGNMKTHQNNFHSETLQDLTAKFVRFSNEGYIPECHRFLFEYFKTHYKNSNKGVKGRGKARKISDRKPQSSGRKGNKHSKPSQYSLVQMEPPPYVHGLSSCSTSGVANIPRGAQLGGYALSPFPVEGHAPSPASCSRIY